MKQRIVPALLSLSSCLVALPIGARTGEAERVTSSSKIFEVPLELGPILMITISESSPRVRMVSGLRPGPFSDPFKRISCFMFHSWINRI